MASRDFYIKDKDAKGRTCFRFAGSDFEIQVRQHPGFYLTHTQPGSTTQTRISPANAMLQAALRLFRNAVLKGIRDAYMPRAPANVPTDIFREAWTAYTAVLQANGVSHVPKYLEYPSIYDIVENGTQVLVDTDLFCVLVEPVPLNESFCASMRAGTHVRALHTDGTETLIVLGGTVGQMAELPESVPYGTMVKAYLPGAGVDPPIKVPSA
ncbi:MAG: hypothetical protein EBY17_25110 [Acidobacteriia bacterium]|nr:hypothetical protein [Terriglobia bacterium]